MHSDCKFWPRSYNKIWNFSVKTVNVNRNSDFFLQNEHLIKTSHTGTILNSLSHLVGATTRAKFTVGLIRGLGSNLPEAAKKQLAAKVYEAMGEAPPDPSQPLNVRVGARIPRLRVDHGIILAYPY